MNLDVLIPSLFLPAQSQTLFPPPHVPALEKLLTRADRRPEASTSSASWLCERWGLRAPYPIAPLLAAHDGLAVSNDAWLFAEPVHLVPDRDRVKLYPANFLDLQTAESAELIATLNSHFADRDLQFLAPTADRWYVGCALAEIPATTPPNVTRFGSLADFHPKSTGTLNWRALQNEAQMLLHGHPANQAREAAGQPLINGVWFWGGGALPEVSHPGYDCVVANPGLATQLAKMSGIDVQPLSWNSVNATRRHVLIVIDSCGAYAGGQDIPAWSRELELLENDWFRPILQTLSKGLIQRLSLHVPDPECASSFHLSRRNQLLRFWRATKPLSTYA